jgi:hypothetical protein
MDSSTIAIVATLCLFSRGCEKFDTFGVWHTDEHFFHTIEGGNEDFPILPKVIVICLHLSIIILCFSHCLREYLESQLVLVQSEDAPQVLWCEGS